MTTWQRQNNKIHSITKMQFVEKVQKYLKDLVDFSSTLQHDGARSDVVAAAEAALAQLDNTNDMVASLAELRAVSALVARHGCFPPCQTQPAPGEASPAATSILAGAKLRHVATKDASFEAERAAAAAPAPAPVAAPAGPEPPLVRLPRRRAVLAGLAIGDSLGSTSEFTIPWEVAKLFRDGWPLTYITHRFWNSGAPTDDTDMTMAIVRACLPAVFRHSLVSENAESDTAAQPIADEPAAATQMATFAPVEVAKEFVRWVESGPVDAGATTRLTLAAIRGKEDPIYWAGAKAYYEKNPNGAANGSLMRNAAVPVLLADRPVAELLRYWRAHAARGQVLDATVQQGIVTHYSPLPVLTCVLHSLLIHGALQCEEGPPPPPTPVYLAELLAGPWADWKAHTQDSACREWLETVGAAGLAAAEAQVLEELGDFVAFDPYHQFYKGISGYCVLSLKVALWALHWSLIGVPACGVPGWLPLWPFLRARFEAIRWVVLIGADADTYGAIAGALLGAWHRDLPPRLLETLQVYPDLERAFP